MKFGLIGKDVRNSFSKAIHESLGYSYDLVSLNEEELQDFFEKKDFKGINVTIPYKQEVIKYLDVVSDSVKKIGACNCIVNKDGKLYGYNTDYDGVKYLIEKKNFNLNNKNILIFGTGGTRKTVSEVLKDLGVKNIFVASRSPKENQYSYDEIYALDVDFIVNTTPNGMIGYSDNRLVDLSKFSNIEGVIDVIYNPLRTLLLLDSQKLDIPYSNGLPMLVYQAIRASELFLDKTYSKDVADSIFKDIYTQKLNIVLIGMPGVGKTTIGKQLAKEFKKTFVDMDELIVNKENRTINEIFANDGETYFRKVEHDLCEELSTQNNLVISTGGGVILNEENVSYLCKNGLVIFLDRDIKDFVITNDRPLTKSKEELEKLYEQRHPLYVSSCDIKVTTNKLEEDIEKIKELIYETINC